MELISLSLCPTPIKGTKEAGGFTYGENNIIGSDIGDQVEDCIVIYDCTAELICY